MRCPESRLNRRMGEGRLRDGRFLVMSITKRQERGAWLSISPPQRLRPSRVLLAQSSSASFAASCFFAQLSASRGSEKSW